MLRLFLDTWINVSSQNNKPECCGGFVGDLRHWLCPRLLLHWSPLTKMEDGLSWFSLFRTLSYCTLNGITVLHNEYVPVHPRHSNQLWCNFKIVFLLKDKLITCLLMYDFYLKSWLNISKLLGPVDTEMGFRGHAKVYICHLSFREPQYTFWIDPQSG